MASLYSSSAEDGRGPSVEDVFLARRRIFGAWFSSNCHFEPEPMPDRMSRRSKSFSTFFLVAEFAICAGCLLGSKVKLPRFSRASLRSSIYYWFEVVGSSFGSKERACIGKCVPFVDCRDLSCRQAVDLRSRDARPMLVPF